MENTSPDDHPDDPSDLVEHDELIQTSFRRQVGIFEGDDSVFARKSARPQAWLDDLDPDAIVLDVACGAAHVSQQVAPHVRQVVGIDLTPELLEVGRTRLADLGITNVLLQTGNAHRLPFVDDSFDAVVCRSTMHHLASVAGPLAEMARVCRPGGRVVIDDMVAPSAEVRDALDDLHRLIDPSHRRLLLRDELVDELTRAVGPVVSVAEAADLVLPLDLFLTEQSDTDAVEAALRAELDGTGPVTGLGPVLDGDALSATITGVVVVATPEP